MMQLCFVFKKEEKKKKSLCGPEGKNILGQILGKTC